MRLDEPVPGDKDETRQHHVGGTQQILYGEPNYLSTSVWIHPAGLTRLFSIPRFWEGDPGFKRRVPRIVWVGHDDGGSLRGVWPPTTRCGRLPIPFPFIIQGVDINVGWHDVLPVAVSFGGPNKSRSMSKSDSGRDHLTRPEICFSCPLSLIFSFFIPSTCCHIFLL